MLITSAYKLRGTWRSPPTAKAQWLTIFVETWTGVPGRSF
jgi:hypothetical protein